MKSWIQAVTLLVLMSASLHGQRYVPSTSNPSGEEIVAVFITAESCIGSRQPHMHDTVERLKLALAKKASQRREAFSVIGVSLDWNTQVGVAHLTKFGAFDEILAGRNWFGTGATRFIWRDLPGQPTTPQVLVLRRAITPTETGVIVTKESELRRIIGANEIKKWVDAGAPLSGGN